jgi:hypothetical protein
MPTPTYTALATRTLTGSAASVTFSSIPATYRDLILVIQSQGTTTQDHRIRFNGDSGSNYSRVSMSANTSAALSGSGSGSEGVISSWAFATTGQAIQIVIQIMDYSATDKHKTALVRSNNPASGVEAFVLRYASTSALTSILLFPSTGSWATGGTFSLYGIVA